MPRVILINVLLPVPWLPGLHSRRRSLNPWMYDYNNRVRLEFYASCNETDGQAYSYQYVNGTSGVRSGSTCESCKDLDTPSYHHV